MEENAAEETRYMKNVPCPGCGHPMTLDLQLCRMEDNLYVWFEGLCADCRHKVVDPMPILRAELNDVVRQIMAN